MKNKTLSFITKSFAIIALMAVSFATEAQNTYVIVNNSHYLAINGNAIDNNVTAFNPSTCLWASAGSNSGSTYQNTGNNRYLRYNSDALSTTRNETNATTFYLRNTNRLCRTKSGSNYSNYLCYDADAWKADGSAQANCYQVTVTPHDMSFNTPTISGGVESFSATGSNSTFSHVALTYTPAYTRYAFNGNNHFWYDNSDHNSAPLGITTGITYSWTLSGVDGYAEVDATGKVTYTTLVPTHSITATLKCTATHTASGTTTSATKTITFVNNIYPESPVISFENIEVSGDLKAKTTINGSGNTVYYTTDGSDPTTSDTRQTYSGTFNVANNTLVKAVTAKTMDGTTYYSPVVSLTAKVQSGILNSTVILNDYEDHNWTYYKGVDASVDGGHYNTTYLGKLYSPNPRNVKITYRAYNTITSKVILGNTETNISSTNGAPCISHITGEGQSTMVYYQTLEQGSTEGEYPYQVISNPFSKRPSTGSGAGKQYYGFGGWKIISGADYIKGKSNNATLSLDEEITFENLPYPNVNCTSAEIVLEATWVAVTPQRITSNNNETIAAGGNYETKLVVLSYNGTYTRTITVNGPCTIMMVEPDGSAAYNTGDYILQGVPTPATGATNITKLENAQWNPNAAINAQGRNLWIGRGVTTTTTQNFYPQGSNAATNQVVKIESGKYAQLQCYSINQTAGNLTKQWVILGCDYDRATNNGISNSPKLEFTGYLHIADNKSGIVPNSDAGANTYMSKIWMKSGSFMTGVAIKGGEIANSFYICSHSGGNTGKRYLEIQGGRLHSNIAGGRDSDRDGVKNNANYVNTEIRIKGGLIEGSIYGGAQNLTHQGSRQIVLTGGEVNGWIAGGANGTDASGGLTDGATYIYVGGDSRVDSKGSPTSIGASIGGNVYGAGCGHNSTSTSGQISFGTNVVIADNAYVERGVYGGGSLGYCKTDQTAYVYVTGGHVAGKSGDYTDRNNVTTTGVIGGVFGGARMRGGGEVKMYMTGGLVESGFFGGSNYTGTIEKNVTMQINGGQVGTSTKTANVHGGGYGQPTIVTGNVDITIGATGAERDAEGVTIYGDVYGGSALGYVNGEAVNATKHTNVTLNAGTINGSLYGGGLGQGTTAANVYGPVQVTVNGGSVNTTSVNGSGAVYGCNNVYGAPQSTVKVDIYGTNSAPSEGSYALDAVYGGGNKANYAAGTPQVTVHNCDNSIGYVYGGGNAADITGTNHGTDVTIWGGNVIGNVFGGGNGSAVGTQANVSGGTNVKIYGGTILNVFGGSNTRGTIGGDINVEVEQKAENVGGDPCSVKIDNLYGGGNLAASAAGSISIGCCDTIKNVYGGANQADVTGDIALNITKGHIGNVFGGNNTSGNISGTISVIVEDENDGCGMLVGNVFGGGNKAAYSVYGYNTSTGAPLTSGTPIDDPVVKILNGTVTNNVYGGGLGSTAVMYGDPVVTIGDNTSGHESYVAKVMGDVYGGGDAAAVVGSTQVNVVKNSNTTIGNLYGGGNAADVSSTDVNIDGGTIGNVFGGGHGDRTASPQKEAKVNGDVAIDITGGTISQVFGGSNSKGDISGDVEINVNDASTSEDYTVEIGNVYGGGNLADYEGSPAVNIKSGYITGSVFGGGNGDSDDDTHETAKVTGSPVVTIGDAVTTNKIVTIDGNVFGGGNAANVQGAPKVVINDCSTVIGTKTTGTSNEKEGTVYGGGNAADITGTGNGTDVTINGGNIYRVFAGGNGVVHPANIAGNATLKVNGGTIGEVFGGSNSQGTIGGYPKITISAASSTCPLNLTDLYGGGNEAPCKGGTLVVQGCDSIINVYGGANKADVDGNITLTINSGHIGNVYGGNNNSGNIMGSITVNIDSTNSCWNVNNVYGGGNLATYSVFGYNTDGTMKTSGTKLYSGTVVNIKNGKVKCDVFGGGKGDGNEVSTGSGIYKGQIIGNTTVNMTGGSCRNIYGGGDAAPVVGSTSVTVDKNVSESVYGGGLGATAVIKKNGTSEGNTSVVIKTNAVIGNNVFGGGNAGAVEGNTSVIIGRE